MSTELSTAVLYCLTWQERSCQPKAIPEDCLTAAIGGLSGATFISESVTFTRGNVGARFWKVTRRELCEAKE